ncbi:MAG TPA: hypothetical protein VHQ45_03380 [Gemmatimonadaceae bacterium]|jgi:uncharacterized protein YceH (UPF0502 family)|nr:hypothetical protein [Gemmatimonadaceae bacterium]
MSTSALESSAQRELRELRSVLALVGEELAGFRRRAQQAETRVRELEVAIAAAVPPAAPLAPVAPERAASAGHQPDDAERIAELEQENADLRARLEEATTRTRQLLDRMRFLRQQREEEDA